MIQTCLLGHQNTEPHVVIQEEAVQQILVQVDFRYAGLRPLHFRACLDTVTCLDLENILCDFLPFIFGDNEGSKDHHVAVVMFQMTAFIAIQVVFSHLRSFHSSVAPCLWPSETRRRLVSLLAVS